MCAKNVFTLFSLTGILLISSCVPSRKFEELKAKQAKCEDERNALSSANKSLEDQVTEQKAAIAKFESRIDALINDTTVLGSSIRKLTRQYDKINQLNDDLLKKQAELNAGSQRETAKLMGELETMKTALITKEDELKELEKDLRQKEGNLKNLTTELEKREKRVNELEEMIAQKDAKVKELKDRVTAALLGFKDKGMSIEQKNGKIYVSLEAKLLFAKGSTAIDSEGKKALVELAKVLESQSDISVLVEGHTDVDKLAGGGNLKDNWDLSVLRATSVVRVLAENPKIDPKQLTAAGRGEYSPIDEGTTEESKAKNRRIEVILTPNLDELFNILEKE